MTYSREMNHNHCAVLHALQEERAEVAALQAQHRATLSERKSALEHTSNLAWDLEDLELHLHELQEQSMHDSATRHEIERLVEQRNHLEEQVLRHMLRVDELTLRYDAEERQLNELQRSLSIHESLLHQN